MSQNIEFYNINAVKCSEQYLSISFDSVHRSWINKVDFNVIKSALDIGAGSGRDALMLSNYGLRVTAVEPAESLMSKGKEHTGSQVHWLKDTLPKLKFLETKTYDLILISAVWMHLNDKQQSESLMRLRTLLNKHGILIITLRHGTFTDGRTSHKVNSAQLIQRAKLLGLDLLQNHKTTDKLQRDNIDWETLVFRL